EDGRLDLQIPAAPSAPPLRKSPVSMPEKFSGQMDMFPAFLGQCQLFMSLRPKDFPNDRAKVGFIISLLSGQAAKWATPLLTQDSPLLDNFQGFLQQMRIKTWLEDLFNHRRPLFWLPFFLLKRSQESFACAGITIG
uniref:DUF4939 domain-containing protein n=1 Tax=Pseudonaja textilis TaxID=8673 RepID=A0A670Z5P7_PSETE